jgi:hypothetical protein
MLRPGTFRMADKILAWILAGVCSVGGGAGVFLAATHAHWGLGLVSAAFLVLGVLYGVAAWRGRPFSWMPRKAAQRRAERVNRKGSPQPPAASRRR